MTMLRTLTATTLAAAFALAAGPASAEMKTQWVDYSQGDTKLKAYMAYDDKVTGKHPAILMVHDREGMTDHTKQMAENWSKLGYVVFAADIFGVVPKNLEEVLAHLRWRDMARVDPATRRMPAAPANRAAAASDGR